MLRMASAFFGIINEQPVEDKLAGAMSLNKQLGAGGIPPEYWC